MCRVFIKDYLNSPVISLYNYIKFNESAFDTHLQNFTRSTAVNWACLKLDHKDCIISAQKAYDAWINNRYVLHKQHFYLSNMLINIRLLKYTSTIH